MKDLQSLLHVERSREDEKRRNGTQDHYIQEGLMADFVSDFGKFKMAEMQNLEQAKFVIESMLGSLH